MSKQEGDKLIPKDAFTKKEIDMLLDCVEGGIMGDPKDAEKPVFNLLKKLLRFSKG